MTTTAQSRAFVPDQGDLNSIERELRFVPSQTQNPRTLTREQIAQYNRDGYIRGVRIFSPDEIAGIRRYCDDLIARTLAAGDDSYSITTAHKKHGRVYDILTDPRIVACVRDLLGENLVGWGAHFFCKMPRDNKAVAWHQDAIYWPLTPTKTVTVWLAIDDADPENANMRFIPGSHQFGPLMHLPSEAAEDNVLNQKVENPERFGTPVDDALRAGEISLHNDLLLHGSEPNRSDRRRCGLTLRYCAVEVRAHLGWNEKGVVVSGSDPDNHWANPSRPENE